MVWTKPVFDKVGVGMVVVITKGSPGLGSLEQGLAREWGVDCSIDLAVASAAMEAAV